MTLLVGLTGGIACGKSFVSAALAKRGALVIDLDLIARQVVEPGTPGLSALVESFGPDILTDTGVLNRKKLGKLVFEHDTFRMVLNNLMAPLIDRQLHKEIQAAIAKDVPIVILDTALLFESGLDASCNGGIIVVDCDPETQIARMASRDGFNPEEAQSRIRAQMNPQDRRNKATWLIDNRGPFRDLTPDIDRVWDSLLSQV